MEGVIDSIADSVVALIAMISQRQVSVQGKVT